MKHNFVLKIVLQNSLNYISTYIMRISLFALMSCSLHFTVVLSETSFVMSSKKIFDFFPGSVSLFKIDKFDITNRVHTNGTGIWE